MASTSTHPSPSTVQTRSLNPSIPLLQLFKIICLSSSPSPMISTKLERDKSKPKIGFYFGSTFKVTILIGRSLDETGIDKPIHNLWDKFYYIVLFWTNGNLCVCVKWRPKCQTHYKNLQGWFLLLLLLFKRKLILFWWGLINWLVLIWISFFSPSTLLGSMVLLIGLALMSFC